MNKGERTKQSIIQQTAPLFNEQGYFGTSMRDVMRVTGLQKGSIYRYFDSKDDLALAAFDFSYARIRQRFTDAIVKKKNTVDRLEAIVLEFSNILSDPYLSGGCPIFNTAVEGDDAHPLLLKRARKAMNEWREMIHITVEKGIEREEMKKVDADEVASILISSIEGSIVMTKLYKVVDHIKHMVRHLQNYIRQVVAT